MARYRAKNGRIDYQTQAKPLGTGGEGCVYEIMQHPTLVAKIYHPHRLNSALEQKLNAMVAHAPDDATRKSPLNHVSIAWPLDTLYNGSQFVGYVMPKIPKSDDLYVLLQPQQRTKRHPTANHLTIYRVASNFARAVDSIHQKEHIIGDVNFKNALFNNQALITLVDCDSMQVKDAHGTIHRCLVGLPEFTAPELQGADFSRINRTKESDTFGLAILLFQLLMQGFHPFAGRPLPGAPDVEQVHVYCITKKIFPYVTNHAFAPPLAAPPFNALPAVIRTLFTKAFTTSVRPSAEDWAETLKLVESRLIQCTSDKNHWHPSDGKCVICAVTSNTQQMRKNPVAQPTTQVPLVQANIPQPTPRGSPTTNTSGAVQSPTPSSSSRSFNVLWLIGILIVIGLCMNPIRNILSGAADIWYTVFGPGYTTSNVNAGSTDMQADFTQTDAVSQSDDATIEWTSVPDAQPTQPVVTVAPTALPATQPHLWIRKKDGSDTPDCISIQITGIDTLYWRLVARDSPLPPAVFDGGGNARLCDDPGQGLVWILGRDGFYIDILNPNMDPVPGGHAPAKGGDIFIATWELK